MSARLILALLITGLLVLPASASAATKNGITPVAPKAGKSVPAGKSPTFRLRAKGPGQVWVYVCKNKRKNREGLICPPDQEDIGRARKKAGVFRFKPKFYDFPASGASGVMPFLVAADAAAGTARSPAMASTSVRRGDMRPA